VRLTESTALMLALAVNYLVGRRGLPRCLEFSVLDPAVEPREVRPRSNCPTCSPAAWTANCLAPRRSDAAPDTR
jgi:hypothetical protein